MTFYEDLAMLSGVYKKDGMFFAHMITQADPKTMEVHLSSELKSQIMSAVGSTAKNKTNAADQILRRLKKQRLIKSKGVGSYMIQPKIHGLNNAVEKINSLSDVYIKISTIHDNKKRLGISVGTFEKDNKTYNKETGEILFED